MAILESVEYDKVVHFGKQAVTALKEGNMDQFSSSADEGWDCFPKPPHEWNQAYNYSKMIFKGFFKNRDFVNAEIWLNRMIEVNKHLNFEDDEVLFESGKFEFELTNYVNSLDKFKTVVKECGLRYFENEDPKYLDFYKNPDKYIKN